MPEYVTTSLHIFFLLLQIVVLNYIFRSYLDAHGDGRLRKFVAKRRGELFVDLMFFGTFVTHIFLWAKDSNSGGNSLALMPTYAIFSALTLRQINQLLAAHKKEIGGKS